MTFSLKKSLTGCLKVLGRPHPAPGPEVVHHSHRQCYTPEVGLPEHRTTLCNINDVLQFTVHFLQGIFVFFTVIMCRYVRDFYCSFIPRKCTLWLGC